MWSVALDVFPVEPLPVDNRLIAHQRVVLTAHAPVGPMSYVELWRRVIFNLKSAS